MEDGYTLDEAASRLGISKTRVAKWISDGRLPTTAPGVVSEDGLQREVARRDSRSWPRRAWERVWAFLKVMP